MKVLRFLYANYYALLLIVFGLAVFFIPNEIFFTILKIMISIWSIVGGCLLLSKWRSRKRLIKILVGKNRNEIRFDTFRTVRQTHCGQQIIGIVLSDLRKQENYRCLSKSEWILLEKKAYGETVVNRLSKSSRKT